MYTELKSKQEKAEPMWCHLNAATAEILFIGKDHQIIQGNPIVVLSNEYQEIFKTLDEKNVDFNAMGQSLFPDGKHSGKKNDKISSLL